MRQKYIGFSPHALRAYKLAASCLGRQWEAAEKNTLVFRQKLFFLLDLVARPHSELRGKWGKVKNFRGTIIQRGCYKLIVD